MLPFPTYLIMLQKTSRLVHFALLYSTIDSLCIFHQYQVMSCYPHATQISYSQERRILPALQLLVPLFLNGHPCKHDDDNAACGRHAFCVLN